MPPLYYIDHVMLRAVSRPSRDPEWRFFSSYFELNVKRWSRYQKKTKKPKTKTEPNQTKQKKKPAGVGSLVDARFANIYFNTQLWVDSLLPAPASQLCAHLFVDRSNQLERGMSGTGVSPQYLNPAFVTA